MSNNKCIRHINYYLATVHIHINHHSAVTKTMIAADSQEQAMSMLASIYGVGNVLSVIFQNTSNPLISPDHSAPVLSER